MYTSRAKPLAATLDVLRLAGAGRNASYIETGNDSKKNPLGDAGDIKKTKRFKHV